MSERGDSPVTYAECQRRKEVIEMKRSPIDAEGFNDDPFESDDLDLDDVPEMDDEPWETWGDPSDPG
jgi:hypothetical protein